MNLDEILFLGMNGSVAAVSKRTGEELWSTDLPGGGCHFVTVLSDGALIFACSNGKLHCLRPSDGEILWTNGLKGYGYGLACLSLMTGQSAPDSAAMRKILDEQAAAASQTSSAGATS